MSGTDTFESFCRSLGLRPGKIIADDRWRRCPTDDHPRKRNGAYILGARFGAARNYATMSEFALWRPDGATDVPAFDPAALRAAHQDAERAQQARRAASREARVYYRHCTPLRGGHPYLEAHQLDITGCYGLKVDHDGWIVVPALRNGQVVSVQRISPDGVKRYWKGAPIKHASYTIERPGAQLTVVCEGLATGLAIFAAVRTCRVLVAFDSGNLGHVAKMAVGMATIASDNDRDTEARIGRNPGLLAAQNAAQMFGLGIAVPPVEPGESDWCDVRNRWVRDRMAERRPRERESDVRRAVDAQVAALITQSARFVAHPDEAFV